MADSCWVPQLLGTRAGRRRFACTRDCPSCFVDAWKPLRERDDVNESKRRLCKWQQRGSV